MPDDLSSPNYSEVAANNTTAGATGWAANSAPTSAYTVIRDKMAAFKRWWNRVSPTQTSGGAANVQTLTYGVAPNNYTQGDTYTFIAGFSNSGATTLNVNALGAKAINKNGALPLVGGEILAGAVVTVMFDNTGAFQLTDGSLTVPNTVANGLTGLATITAHGVMMGEGTSPVAASAAGVAGQVFTSAGAAADGLYKNRRLVTTKTADYTLLAADQGGKFVMNSAANHVFTLPDDATVGNGWEVEIVNQGTGILSITRAGTDTIASGGATNLTSIKLSQGDAGKIVADGVSHGIFWWSGARHFDSGQQTINNGGLLTLAHGLGVQPQVIDLWLHNTTGELNYSIGDEVIALGAMGASVTSANGFGTSTVPDATNLTIRFGSQASVFQVINKTTGGLANITAGNWAAIWRAWIYN